MCAVTGKGLAHCVKCMRVCDSSVCQKCNLLANSPYSACIGRFSFFLFLFGIASSPSCADMRAARPKEKVCGGGWLGNRRERRTAGETGSMGWAFSGPFGAASFVLSAYFRVWRSERTS